MTIDAARYGYKPIKGNQVQLVFADLGPHLVMFSDSAAIVYQTQPDHPEVGHGPGTMTAYVFNLKTGALVRKQEWRTRARQSVIETKESEARIVALSRNRYAVMANAILYTYDAVGNQLFEKLLGDGMWSMQPTDGGDQLLLRHEKTIDGLSHDVEYSWIDPTKMKVLATFEDGDPSRSQTGLLGVGRMLAYSQNDGLHVIFADNADRVICGALSCHERVLSDAEAASGGVAIASRFGVGVVPLLQKGPMWFRNVTPVAGLDRVTVIPIVASLNGKYLAVYVSRGGKSRSFDGVRLALSSEFFVYSVQDGRRTAIVPGTSAMCAISPDGRKLISFDGHYLNVYTLSN